MLSSSVGAVFGNAAVCLIGLAYLIVYQLWLTKHLLILCIYLSGGFGAAFWGVS